MNVHWRWFIIIVVLAMGSLWVSLPDTTGIEWDINNDGRQDVDWNIQQSLGLDLVGGLRVLLEAELPTDAFTLEELQQAANNVARRVNSLGISEPTVQLQGTSRILVELPGIDNPQEAINTIQQTALLEFIEMDGLHSQVDALINQRVLTTEQMLFQQRSGDGTRPDGTVNPITGQPFTTVMTGAGLQAASALTDTGIDYYIRFELTGAGAEVFGPFTGAHIGQPLGIVLDGVLISAPVIQARLDTGGVIEGDFDQEEAQRFALQLRSGALPIPLRVASTETVGATLGQESVTLSIRAGIIGVFIVLTFMIVYYRIPGAAASLALLVFILLNLAIFKIIPITLTLPGITGFLISIGTAVDGNILIFERMKEELRAQRPLDEALIAGFDRAWHSIRDSNFSTIIICAILFLFGLTPGASIVSGFAVTLAIGLVLNLFTAVIVTRTFLHILVALLRQPLNERGWLLGV